MSLMTMMPIIMALLPYALKIIDYFIDKNKEDKELIALRDALAKKLMEKGVKGIRTRYEQEADQKQQGDDEWTKREAAAASAQKPDDKKPA